MDSIVLGALNFDGVTDWMEVEGINEIKRTASNNGMFILPLVASIFDSQNCMSSLQMVCWTSIFCIVLTCILLLLCHLFPPHELELVLDVSSFKSHIQCLRSNRKTLQKVTVKAFQQFGEVELLPIFQELAEIPELQAFAVDLRLPAGILSYFLKASKQLQHLSVFFQVSGTDRDMASLADSIQKHPSLKSICIESCNFDTDLDERLDPLVSALAETATLRLLSIHNLQSSPYVFGRLFQSNTIQTLELSNIPVLRPDLVCRLQSSQSIRSLVAPLHLETSEAWAQVIKCNNSLSKLSLILEKSAALGASRHRQDMEDQVNEAFTPILGALAWNTSLQRLTVDVSEGLTLTLQDASLNPTISSQSLKALTASLRKNTSLQCLSIGPCSSNLINDTPAVQDLVTALQHNYKLETLEIFASGNPSPVLRVPEIDFLVDGNKKGRGKLLVRSPISTSDLIAFVKQPGMDAGLVFHVLSEKPDAILQAI